MLDVSFAYPIHLRKGEVQVQEDAQIQVFFCRHHFIPRDTTDQVNSKVGQAQFGCTGSWEQPQDGHLLDKLAPSFFKIGVQ